VRAKYQMDLLCAQVEAGQESGSTSIQIQSAAVKDPQICLF
jgi:hypothetical protein